MCDTSDDRFVPKAAAGTPHFIFQGSSTRAHPSHHTPLLLHSLGSDCWHHIAIPDLSSTDISHYNGAFDTIHHSLVVPPTAHSLWCHFPSLYVSSQYFIIMGIPVSVPLPPHPRLPFLTFAETLMKTIILQSPDVGLHTAPH